MMQWLKTKRIVHEVEADGNLNLLISRFIDVVEAGFNALATAISADVQRQIDAEVARLNAATAEQKDAIDQHNKGE